MAAAPQIAPLEIADNSDGCCVPMSAWTYMRYVASCRRLWACRPAEFERYERFLGKIEDRFGLAASEATLENTATELLKGACIDIDYVGLEELDNENR